MTRTILLLTTMLTFAAISAVSQTQIANNAAEIAGKIVMLADGGTARTVTGSFTFDRDPSAPFAVTASSAVVTNLDADLLDGVQGSGYAALADNETVSGAWVFSNALLDLTNASGVLRLSGTTGPRIFVGDTANASMTAGITVNQAGADNEIIALKSSDVAHGITDEAETDTYFWIKKSIAAAGGVRMHAFAATGLTFGALNFQAAQTDAAETTKAVGNYGVIRFNALLRSGTTVTAIGANGNLASFDTNGTTRFILDADGDSHQDVGTAWTNFDAYDDAQILDTLSYFVSRPTDPIKARFASALDSLADRDVLQRAELVTFNDDGHHFVNMSRLSMLLTGAVRQQADETKILKTRLRDLEAENLRLARRLVALESASAVPSWRVAQ